MIKHLFFFIFVSMLHLSYGQKRYTIRGEFPDHSLDNEYVLLYDFSSLQGEYERSKQAFIDSILVVDKVFHYEGTINQEPFLALVLCSKSRYLKYSTTFIVEPGNIQMRVVDWASDGDVSGTSINDDYNKYIIERRKLIGKTRSLRTKREDTIKSDTLKDNKCISLSEVYTYAEEGKFIFLEKYAMYPNVVRYWLSFYLNGRRASKSPVFSKCLNLMPKADRDILLAWRDYTIKKEEYREKTKSLLDSIHNNAPRFIEAISK